MPACRRLTARLLSLLLLATTLALGIVASGTTTATAAPDTGPTRLSPADLAEADAVITGLVYDPTGELVDDIQVEAFAASDPNGEPVATDLTYEEENSASHGAYTLSVPAGQYVIRFSSPDWHDRTFETHYYGGGAGTPVSVATGDSKLLEDVTLVRDTGVPVTGTVTSTPTAGAEFYASLYRLVGDVYWQVDWAEVENGRYTFDHVNRSRTYTVAITGYDAGGDAEFPEVFLGQQPAAPLATTFTLPADSRGTSLAAISVVRGVQVSGTVQQVDGEPVTQLGVQFYAVVDGRSYALNDNYYFESESGEYTRSLIPGTYTVAASDAAVWDDRAWVFLGDTYDVDAATTFTVPATGAVGLDPITLLADPDRATITGTVARTGGGTVPAGTRAALWAFSDSEDGSGWEWVRDTAVREDGTFELVRSRQVAEAAALTIGVYHESDEDFPRRFLGDVDSVEEATSFPQPAAGSTYAAGTITVPTPQHTSVTGTVRRGGEPAAGAWVTLYAYSEDWGWDYANDSVTGPDGGYSLRIDGLREEGYTRLTVRVDGSDGWNEVYLGGADSVEDAQTVDLPDAGETVALDPIDQVQAPGSLRGRVLTEDGGSLGEDYEIDSTLYRWTESEWSDDPWEYFDRSWSYRSPSYSFSDLAPGTYTVRSTVYSYDGPSPYLSTYANGTTQAPAGPGAPGTFEVTEDSSPTAGPDVVLQRGVALTGTVTTTTGMPLADVSVSVGLWTPDGLGGFNVENTDEDGRYTVLVPPASDVYVSTYRSGFAPFSLGGEPQSNEQNDENALAVGADGATLDITLTPVWGQVGTVAGTRLDYCLQRSSYSIEFADRELWLDKGSIVSDDAWRDDIAPFDPADREPLLAVMPGGTYGNHTWGVSADGRTLCVVFQRWDEFSDDAFAAQALLTIDPDGGLDVTYNYDAVATSREGAKVGYTDGEGDAGQVVVFPGGDVVDGYADSNTDTGLVHHSRGSTQRGRYVFHFDGFNERDEAPEMIEGPFISGYPSYGVGSTLTADPGRWAVAGVETSDLELTYEWRRGSSVLQRSSSPTYVVPAKLAGKRIRVRVTARVPWHDPGFAYSRQVLIGDAAATNTVAPAVTPGAGQVGDTFTADPGTWTPASTVNGELTYAYQWFVNGRHRADGETFYAEEGLEGASIKVRVIVTAPGHVEARAVSAPVKLAALPPVAWSTPPAVTGTPQVGNTLELAPGVVEGDLEPATTVRWSVGGKVRNADAGSGGLAYTPTANDVGKLVGVQLAASAPGRSKGTWNGVTGPVVAAGQTVAGLTIEVRPAPASGQESWVTVCNAANTQCLGGKVDASGDYATTGASGASYKVTVRSGNPALVDQTVTVTMPGDGSAKTQRVTLTTPPVPPTNVTIPGNVGGDGRPTIVPGAPQTFQVTGCATTATPRYSIALPGGSTITGAMAKGTVTGDRATFTAVVPAWQVPTSQFVFKTNIPATCGGAPTEITVYIDPSGYVTDQYGRPLPGAVVTLLRADGLAGPYAQVPDGSDIMSPENRANPSITDGDGFFRWDVTEGWYKVTATATACSTTTTEPMQVLPARVDLLVKLTCDVAAPAATPGIAGTPTVGSTLTTDPAVWDSRFEPSIQWLRRGVAIPGATDTSYQVSAADAGEPITVRHTVARPAYTQEEGRGATVEFASAQATSAPVTAVTAGTPTGSVAISGKAALGSVLTATPGTWTVAGLAFAYTWTVDGTAVATGARFTVPLSAVGRLVAVTARATRTGYPAGTATSTAVRVAKVAPTLTLKVVKAKGKKGKKAKATTVSVTVKATGVVPTGKVTVRIGKKVVGTVTLKKGTGTLKLKRLKKGKHRLVAGYAGTAVLAPATSKTLTVKVR